MLDYIYHDIIYKVDGMILDWVIYFQTGGSGAGAGMFGPPPGPRPPTLVMITSVGRPPGVPLTPPSKRFKTNPISRSVVLAEKKFTSQDI